MHPNTEPKYIRQTLPDKKEKTEKNMIIVGGYNTPVSNLAYHLQFLSSVFHSLQSIGLSLP